MIKSNQISVGAKVKLMSWEDVAETDNYSEFDNLFLGEVYEIARIGCNGFIQLKDHKGYFHSPNKFDLFILEDPPVNIQWDGQCFEIDGIRIDPIVLKEILSEHEFDDKGQEIEVDVLNNDKLPNWKKSDDAYEDDFTHNHTHRYSTSFIKLFLSTVYIVLS